jgi:hypothetical protein
MTKLKTWLSGLLALQLVLAGSLLAFNYQRDHSGDVANLFDNESIAVDRMQISDGEHNITLSKSGDDKWILPEQDKLPATTSKITSTIDSMADIQFVWPVSTSSSAHQRFEVESDNFQREVKLFDGDELVTHVYIGTSPGFRKVHLRRADDSDVYAVALNSFDFPVVLDEWLDKALFNVADASVIKGPDFTVNKVNDNWQLEDEADTATLEADKVQQLASAFSNFRVQDIAESAPENEPIVFNVTAAGSEWQYSFYQVDDNYYVQRQDIDKVFTLSKYDFERIANVNREAITVAPETTEETNATAEGEDATESTGSPNPEQ